MTQPLVTGGVMDRTRYPGGDESPVPSWFLSTTPPSVQKDTIIVAAASPNVQLGDPKHEGWFLSDFYAFNYLLHGLGSSQTWLTAADPAKLLDKHHQYLHGNPYQERKVVLSGKLLESGEITPVTVVRNNKMIARFLDEVRAASKRAVRQDVPLLLLVFCHGLPNLNMLLDYGDKKRGITPTTLKEAIEPSCRVTLYSTACYSGGWVVNTPSNIRHDPMNVSMLAAASDKQTSNAWQNSRSISRACGSVFTSAIVDTLTSNSSPLIDHDDIPADNTTTLQPEEPDDGQTATYNAFCTSILTCCADRVHRLWHEQGFTFSAQDERWNDNWNWKSGIPSVPLTHFEQRWNKLETVQYKGPDDAKAMMDPYPGNPNFSGSTDQTKTGGAAPESLIGDLVKSICHNRVKVMATLFLQTCPGDWDSGWGPTTRGFLWRQIEDSSPSSRWEFDPDPVAMITFRWELAQIADDLVRRFGLPIPAQQCCLLWDYSQYKSQAVYQGAEKSRRHSLVFHQFVGREIQPEPTQDQGYPFMRFTYYLAAAIVEADLDDDQTMSVVKGIDDHMRRAKEFHQQRTLSNPNVVQRAREWLRSVGRSLRDLGKEQTKSI